LSGNSGVGKSTLVAAVEPGLDIRTGEISQSHHKGKHTTTFSTMYPLAEGGYIIDTPGIKGFGLIDIEDAELAHYFPEMMRYPPDCRFYNCSHTHEPHCAVVEAVKEGMVAWSRYESYLKILDEDDKYRK
jgi:ribosome biogenesis GTPase